MADDSKPFDPAWIKHQIDRYKAVEKRYVEYKNVLELILKSAANRLSPESIVQVRAKSVSSFAEKIHRKSRVGGNPVSEFTDLCGGRIIVSVPSEVKAIGEFIKEHFIIDWENSIDVAKRHAPSEFGYRSVHYIVQLRKGVFPTKEINVKVPDTAYPDQDAPMKAEIQVRTFLEHAWAVFAHDSTYKGSFNPPKSIERELNSLAAVLENADKSFEYVQAGLKTYASAYHAYMDSEAIKREIEELSVVLESDPANVKLATKIGNLALEVGNWQKTLDILLGQFAQTNDLSAIKTIGIALCKKSHALKARKYMKEGRTYLESAHENDTRDAETIIALADSWRSENEKIAARLYQQAFEIDPEDPKTLINHISYQLQEKKDLSVLTSLSPNLLKSIDRCLIHAEAGIDIPEVYFCAGLFLMMLNRSYESIEYYSRAIHFCNSLETIGASIETLKMFEIAKSKPDGYEWIHRLLLLGAATRYQCPSSLAKLKRLASKGKIGPPVVIMAGGCDPSSEKQMKRHGELLIEGFQEFNGTIISGGTTQGISGLAGEVGLRYPAIHTIGYVPKMIPSDATVDNDTRRYREIRTTTGEDFTPLEPLQNWIDIVSSGLNPKDTVLLGIGGGRIAAAEYRIALAMGAQLVLIEDSGREASRLISDPSWRDMPIIHMPADAKSLQAYLTAKLDRMNEQSREFIAREFHERYSLPRRGKDIEAALNANPSLLGLADWNNLPDFLKNSNRQAADHILTKLRVIGCEAYPVTGRKIKPFKFTEQDIRTMAELEHGRWNAERLAEGWRKTDGTKDIVRKLSPYLVSWKKLSPEVRKWDEDQVKDIPDILMKIGMEIRRVK